MDTPVLQFVTVNQDRSNGEPKDNACSYNSEIIPCFISYFTLNGTIVYNMYTMLC